MASTARAGILRDLESPDPDDPVRVARPVGQRSGRGRTRSGRTRRGVPLPDHVRVPSLNTTTRRGPGPPSARAAGGRAGEPPERIGGLAGETVLLGVDEVDLRAGRSSARRASAESIRCTWTMSAAGESVSGSGPGRGINRRECGIRRDWSPGRGRRPAGTRTGARRPVGSLPPSELAIGATTPGVDPDDGDVEVGGAGSGRCRAGRCRCLRARAGRDRTGARSADRTRAGGSSRLTGGVAAMVSPGHASRPAAVAGRWIRSDPRRSRASGGKGCRGRGWWSGRRCVVVSAKPCWWSSTCSPNSCRRTASTGADPGSNWCRIEPTPAWATTTSAATTDASSSRGDDLVEDPSGQAVARWVAPSCQITSSPGRSRLSTASTARSKRYGAMVPRVTRIFSGPGFDGLTRAHHSSSVLPA